MRYGEMRGGCLLFQWTEFGVTGVGPICRRDSRRLVRVSTPQPLARRDCSRPARLREKSSMAQAQSKGVRPVGFLSLLIGAESPSVTGWLKNIPQRRHPEEISGVRPRYAEIHEQCPARLCAYGPEFLRFTALTSPTYGPPCHEPSPVRWTSSVGVCQAFIDRLRLRPGLRRRCASAKHHGADYHEHRKARWHGVETRASSSVQFAHPRHAPRNTI